VLEEHEGDIYFDSRSTPAISMLRRRSRPYSPYLKLLPFDPTTTPKVLYKLFFTRLLYCVVHERSECQIFNGCLKNAYLFRGLRILYQ
jgi:hypothetical protein